MHLRLEHRVISVQSTASQWLSPAVSLMSVRYGIRFRETEQQISVIFVLFLAQLDFTRETFSDGVGQCVKFIEYFDNASLFF